MQKQNQKCCNYLFDIDPYYQKKIKFFSVMQDIAMSIVGISSPSIPLRLKLKTVCKTCDYEIFSHVNAYHFHLMKRCFKQIRKYCDSVHKVYRYNSWRRHLHTENEVIMPF